MHFYAFFIKVGRLTLLYTCIMTIAHLCKPTYIKTFKNAGEYWYYRNHEATL